MQPKSFFQRAVKIIHADSIGRNKIGNVIARDSYFYTNEMTSQKFAARISKQLTTAGIEHKVIKCGNHFAAFRGGASVKEGSHFWVEISAGTNTIK